MKMQKSNSIQLSKEGRELLEDPCLAAILTEVAALAGVTPEEYLIRFEEVLHTQPDLIFGIFEG